MKPGIKHVSFLSKLHYICQGILIWCYWLLFQLNIAKYKFIPNIDIELQFSCLFNPKVRPDFHNTSQYVLSETRRFTSYWASPLAALLSSIPWNNLSQNCGTIPVTPEMEAEVRNQHEKSISSNFKHRNYQINLHALYNLM